MSREKVLHFLDSKSNVNQAYISLIGDLRRIQKHSPITEEYVQQFLLAVANKSGKRYHWATARGDAIFLYRMSTRVIGIDKLFEEFKEGRSLGGTKAKASQIVKYGMPKDLKPSI